jgi:hypothetical protein
MGYKIHSVDGVEYDTTKALVEKVKLMRSLKVMQGATAVFLENFESFTHDARQAIVDAIKPPPEGRGRGRGRKENRNLAPILITCTNVRDPTNRGLSNFKQVRLFAPSEHVIAECFEREVAGWFEGAYSRARTWVAAERHLCATGDMWRVRIALEWRRLTGTSLSAIGGKTIGSVFEATRRLLLRRCTPEEWARHAESRDVDLLREHMPAHVGGDLDALTRALECYSDVETCQPSRFELREQHAAFPRYMAAAAARLTSRARDVGALAPPPRPAPTEDPVPESQSSRPMSMREWRDVKQTLRDRA